MLNIYVYYTEVIFMEKNEKIRRRREQKNKSSKKEKTFNLGKLKREIFQVQNEKNNGFFRYKLLTKRGDFNE